MYLMAYKVNDKKQLIVMGNDVPNATEEVLE
jgi:hypothetical protein